MYWPMIAIDAKLHAPRKRVAEKSEVHPGSTL